MTTEDVRYRDGGYILVLVLSSFTTSIVNRIAFTHTFTDFPYTTCIRSVYTYIITSGQLPIREQKSV